MEPLDRLIQKAEQKALSRKRDPKELLARFEKPPAPPQAHPGEPDLIGQALAMPGIKTEQYGRRHKSAIEADERARKFARALFFSGFRMEEAFRAAGWKYRHSNVNATLKKPVVIDELSRLCAIGRQVLESKAFDVTNGWLELAGSNIMAFLDQAEDGTIRVKSGLAELPEAQQRQIKKIKVTRKVSVKGSGEDEQTEETIETEIELWDKTKALDALSKIQGLYQDKQGDAMKDFVSILTTRLNQMATKTGRVLTQEGQVEKA